MKINNPPVQRLAKIPARPTRGQLRRAFKPYAVSLGELIFCWNSLHNHLADVFELVIKSSSRRMGVSIWHSTDNDYAQRRMLRAAVKVAAQLTVKQREDICWALDRIDDALRHSRNDAVHAPLTFIQSLSDLSIKVIPDMGEHPRAKSLWTKAGSFDDLRDLYRETRALADVLDDFVADIFLALINPSEKPWPVRPALPSANRKKARKPRTA